MAAAVDLHAQSLRLDTGLRDRADAGVPHAPTIGTPVPLRLSPTLGLPATAPASAAYEEVLLEVDVNRQGINRSTVALRRSDGMYLLKPEDLTAFRLKAPSTAPYLHGDAPYFPLDALQGARFTLDEVHQRLVVMAGPEAFEGSLDVVPGARARPSPVKPTYGGFFNYDLVGVYGSGSAFASGTFEGGFFTPFGVLVSSLLATHEPEESRATRLETTFTSDFPERHETLRIGDAVTRPGAWGTAVRFGGVQYGTNFSTDPGLITFPTQAVRGQAIVPSIVDLYVNNALVASRRVDPGPFTITNIPFATGSGNVRMVVRDLNNQQQLLTVSSPFYSTNTLLKAGLSDYSAEAGRIREDLGIASFDYGHAFAMGTFRRGITDRFTVEAHAEGDHAQRAVGFSATTLHPTIGQLDATYAVSRSDAGTGRLVGLGYQRQANPFSFGGQAQWASPEFRRAGSLEGEPLLRRQESLGVGLQMGAFGSLSAIHAAQRFTDRPTITIRSLGYSLPLGRWGQLNVTALRSTGEEESTALAAAITVPLGPNTSASAQAESTRSGSVRDRQVGASFQRNRADDSPWSYRVTTRGADVEGEVGYRGDRAEAQVGVARTEGNAITGRVQLAGGIGFVGDYAFLSRRITGSFGVVQVADYPKVGVYFDNQFVGRTNAKGFFVVPEMRAYDRNTISVREADLPLDATIGSLKLDASPYYRSGVLIDFPVRRVRAAVMTIELDDGTPLPPGALVRVDEGSEEFPSALRGEVYVTGLADRSRLQVRWKSQTCTLDVVYPAGSDPLPDLGKLVCKGMRP